MLLLLLAGAAVQQRQRWQGEEEQQPCCCFCWRREEQREGLVVGAGWFFAGAAGLMWLLPLLAGPCKKKYNEGKGHGRERGEGRKVRRHLLLAGEDERRTKGKGGGAVERGEEGMRIIF